MLVQIGGLLHGFVCRATRHGVLPGSSKLLCDQSAARPKLESLGASIDVLTPITSVFCPVSEGEKASDGRASLRCKSSASHCGLFSAVISLGRILQYLVGRQDDGFIPQTRVGGRVWR